MNERLPYEEQLAQQQWDELSLPDEDMAWANMKRRLEEEDDDRLVPFWLRGCVLWGIVAVLLITITWWMVRPEKGFVKEKPVTQKETIKKIQGKEKNNSDSFQEQSQQHNQNAPKHEMKQRTEGRLNQTEIVVEQIEKKSQKRGIANNKKSLTIITKTEKLKATDRKETTVKIKAKNNRLNDNEKDFSKSEIRDTKTLNHPKDSNNIAIINANTAEKKKTDSLQKQKNETITQSKDQKRDSLKSKKNSFAVGLALQQQLPINGQKLVPYNAEGRKGGFSDYIPSVYLRMYKADKWFIQSEFRYGAPQYTKEFLYKQKIATDTFQQTTTTTSNRLKKTFYHQLPITFNYFVFPRWSVGGGFVWNKFVSAVSEQDIIQHNNAIGTDSIISKGVIINPSQTDSNFVKSYFHGVFETQYKWKRFSFGARYAFGLQPYIKFKLPAGSEQQEKNNSLNLFLRYELWRSTRKQ
ncbi:MAG TPA: hypothetical protein VGQ09_21745 [Chitinophagaceae bacterium]|jgi:hypothetical protein|nr:hypothetical protein [Chitinophagaceae bacterium]